MAERLTRRRLLTGGLFGLTAFGLWQYWGRRLITSPAPTPRSLTPAQLRTLEAAFVELLDSPEDGRRAAADLDSFLADDPEQAARMGLALTLLEHAPAGPLRPRRFCRLDRARRAEVLVAWQDSRLGLRRQIHSSLRQAARFIHFARPETWAGTGYDGPWVGR